MPHDTPVTFPDPSTVAVPVAALLHVPPVVALDKLVIDPTQTLVVPLIDVGNWFTVTISVTVQPEEMVYEIYAVPTAPPVTIPVEPTEATDELLLVQVPPEEASDKDVVNPEHTLATPLMDWGNALTVTVVVVEHPGGMV